MYRRGKKKQMSLHSPKSNSTNNSGLTEEWSGMKVICTCYQKPAHFLSAQKALVSTFFQMFIVLGIYNFDSTKKKWEFLLWPASESRFLCQHLSTANPIHSCKLCSIKSFNAHFASHQCLMVYGKRERKANKWLYEKRNVNKINDFIWSIRISQNWKWI